MSPKKNGADEKKQRKATKKAWKRARPEGAPWVAPILCAKDPRALAELYERAFGFELVSTFPPEGPAEHVEMRHRGRGLIMIGRAGSIGGNGVAPPNGSTSVTQYVYVANVDSLVERARAAGVTVASDPDDAFWGDRVARLVDPEGHAWMFATHRKRVRPDDVTASTAKEPVARLH